MLREVFFDGLPIDPVGPAAEFVETSLQCHYWFAEHAFFEDVPQ
jgi:hypothetical protein